MNDGWRIGIHRQVQAVASPRVAVEIGIAIRRHSDGCRPIVVAVWREGRRPGDATIGAGQRGRVDTAARGDDAPREAGLRNNINVGIHYLGSWLAGNGCVPIHNLMEDAATAEISRSQVWQWVVSPKGVLDDGRKVTVEMVRPMIAEELAKVKATVTAQGEDTASYDQAAEIFDRMSLTPDYPEFLTLPLYEAMA